MSPLTKLFVVMLVVLSLLLTAATVVYVNKEDVIKQSLVSLEGRLKSTEARAADAEQQLQTAQQNLLAAQQQANEQAGRANSQLIAAQQSVADLNVQLAKSASQAATQQLDISRLTEALNASQAATGKLQEEVARLRTSNDTLVKQSSDLNSTVSDLTNKLDVTERERRLLAEQLTSSKGETDRLGAIIKGAGLAPQQQQTAVNRSGLPNINGVIRDIRPIAGSLYATISVGSADAVTKGMEFKVVDRATGSFLGTLVVDSVEPNESTGRLSGPAVAQIKPGVEVKTQL